MRRRDTWRAGPSVPRTARGSPTPRVTATRGRLRTAATRAPARTARRATGRWRLAAGTQGPAGERPAVLVPAGVVPVEAAGEALEAKPDATTVEEQEVAEGPEVELEVELGAAEGAAAGGPTADLTPRPPAPSPSSRGRCPATTTATATPSPAVAAAAGSAPGPSWPRVSTCAPASPPACLARAWRAAPRGAPPGSRDGHRAGDWAEKCILKYSNK